MFFSRSASTKSPVTGQKLTNPKRAEIPTRFPTVFNPVRSAAKPHIKLPKGLVYNPSPAPLSVYDTAAIFLPESDRRIVRHEDKAYPVELMPALSEIKDKKYHLTEKDVIEIQKLRLEDPEKWTKKALAAKFDCSELMVSIASKPAPERVTEMNRRLDIIRDIWSPARARARGDRKRRQEIWKRDGY